MLLDHMKSGLSANAFAGVIGVHRYTLQRWRDQHKEFKEAYDVGTDASLLFWEKMGRSGAAGKLKNFNTGAWVFNMKNRFFWRDRQEVEVNGGKEISIKIDKNDAEL